jgi:alginate O-acetyltransferase complex protein AlgJ
MTASPRLRKIADWAVILLFLGAIWLPLAGTFFHGRFNKATSDMRDLASLPELRLKGSVLKAFPEKFNQYWSDNFGFRGTLIRFLNVAKVRWLRVSTSAFVLLGRAPWLFYTPHPVGTNYDGVRPFTPRELDDWRRVLEQRRDWLQQRGCHYVLFIPPDKQTIYPEYLDPIFRTRHDQSRLDHLLIHLRDHHSPLEILDVRQPMRAAKANERLYHRTDAHWNDRGAFIGYQHLAGTLSKWFPSIRPWPRSDFEEATMDRPGGDLATMVYLADVAHEEWLNLLPRRPRQARPAKEGVAWPKENLEATFPLGKPFATECDDPRLPRAVMFHDSFCLAVQPFLSEHFRRIAYVWHDDFFPEVVENERPEVVIQELLERKLTYVKPRGIGETRP